MAIYRAGQIVTDAEINTGAAQIDLTSFFVNTTTLTQASKLWDIPANTAQGGASWRLTVIGKSVMGTTADGLNWFMGYGPSGATQVEIVECAAGDQPASSTWHWTVIMHFVVNVGSTSGSASLFGTMSAGSAAGTSGITWTNGTTGASFNNTVDNGLQFLFSYPVITGGPALTSYCSTFERMS